jgi:hypothetical protein
MVLDATTDTLEVVLDKSVTTQLSFTVSFNEYDSSSVTPSRNFGFTNNTTAVSLIPAPEASKQRQLRWCSIFNSGTTAVGTKVQFNKNSTLLIVCIVYLRPNESLQYSEEMGWRVFDGYGSEKITGQNLLYPTMRMPEWFATSGAVTTVALTNTQSFCVYLGKAERNFSSIRLRYRVTTGITATIAWAELAIYSGSLTINSNATLTRLGFTDASGVWNSTGQKTTSVTLSSHAIGDDLWAVFSNSTTGTVTSFRAGSSDIMQAGFYQNVTSSSRPSLNTTLSPTVASGVFNPIWLAWEPVYKGN